MNLICFSRKFCYISAIKTVLLLSGRHRFFLYKKKIWICQIFFIPLHKQKIELWTKEIGLKNNLTNFPILNM